MTPPEADDAAQLTAYLLGRLPPDEVSRIEEQYLSDPAFHDRLRAVERDLIDQYVNGEIADREELERHFLVSPARQQRVAFARALNRSLARSAATPEAEGPIASSMWRSRVGRLQRMWQAAAAIVIVAGGAWLLLADRRAQDSEGPVASAPAQSPVDPRGSEPGRAPAPGTGAPIRIATLVLSPTLTRSSAEMPTLTLQGDSDVRLELQVETTGYERYRVSIRAAGGEEIWQQEALKLTTTSSGPAIGVTLDASRLAAGDYTIRLSGVTPAGAVEQLPGYSFRVHRP